MNNTNSTHHYEAFIAARAAWQSTSRLRGIRRRMKRFAYGRQWDDPVTLPDGRRVSMAEHARMNLCEPVTSNLIRQIIKSVVGRFRTDAASASRYSRQPLRSIAEANQLDEIDARTLEEFLISGCAIQRVSMAERPEGPGPWVDTVSPARFFVNPFRDPRGHDIETVGMLHDWSLDELLARLGNNDPGLERELRRIYADAGMTAGIPLADADADLEFHSPAEPSQCRVVEVWRRSFTTVIACHDPETGRCTLAAETDMQALKAANAARRTDGRQPVALHRRRTVGWSGSWFSPSGRLLRRVEARRHPFAVKFYPLIDGEIHPFIEDIIDRQIQVNRTLTMVDRIMAVSAKEVLLLPAEAALGGDYWKLADYAERWGEPGAVIPYRSRTASGSGEVPAPSVINSAGLNAGLSNLLAVEMQMMEQVSGVSRAMRGMTAGSSDTATLYRAQADNSVQSLADIFATFDSFRLQRDALLAP